MVEVDPLEKGLVIDVVGGVEKISPGDDLMARWVTVFTLFCGGDCRASTTVVLESRKFLLSGTLVGLEEDMISFGRWSKVETEC